MVLTPCASDVFASTVAVAVSSAFPSTTVDVFFASSPLRDDVRLAFGCSAPGDAERVRLLVVPSFEDDLVASFATLGLSLFAPARVLADALSLASLAIR